MNARDAWIEDIKKRPGQDRDALIIISGDVRKGKSTLAFKLARLVDPTFTEDRMVFDMEDYINIALELSPGNVVVLDEAIEGAMSREAMTRKNRDMQKFLVTCGERNLIGFVLIPHIDDLDSYIRGRRATDWIMIPERGYAKIHTRASGGDYPGKKKRWDDVCSTSFTKADSPAWDAYKARKRARVQEFKSLASEAEPGEDTPDRIQELIRQTNLILAE